MTTLPKWTRDGLRLLGLALFQILMLFWVAKLYYCARGYFVAGGRGLLGALMHGMPLPSDPSDWGTPRWDLALVRLLAIALLTVLVGVLNRRAIVQLWRDLRYGARHGET